MKKRYKKLRNKTESSEAGIEAVNIDTEECKSNSEDLCEMIVENSTSPISTATLDSLRSKEWDRA